LKGHSLKFALATAPPAAYRRRMDALTLFGLFAVTAMLIFYALEDRSPWCIFGFAVACALGSAYGFLQGAWPFGVVEAIWAGVALGRWWERTRSNC
jgi:uncharacterized RDD family membrane protein YckC